MSEITFDKPFLTYDEMIALMISRDLIIEDKTFAVKALNNFSYYHIINGFKSAFLTLPNTDKYVPGTRFEDLYWLNIVNTDLNNIIFKYILYIEKSLKSKLSYRISSEYGVFTDTEDFNTQNTEDYLYYKNYSNSNNKRQNVLYKIHKCIRENSQKDCIKHYLISKNHLPCWILINVVPFGLTINWYSILKANDKLHICNQYINNDSLSEEQKKEFIIKSFELLKEYRNLIAHGSKTNVVTNLPELPKHQLLQQANGLLTSNEYNNNIGKNDTFAIILLILILVDDFEILKGFYFDLYVFFNKHDKRTFNIKTIYDVFGLPLNTLERIMKYLKNYEM